MGEGELHERLTADRPAPLAADQEPANREHRKEGYADIDQDLLEVHRHTVIDRADVELRRARLLVPAQRCKLCSQLVDPVMDRAPFVG